MESNTPGPDPKNCFHLHVTVYFVDRDLGTRTKGPPIRIHKPSIPENTVASLGERRNSNLISGPSQAFFELFTQRGVLSKPFWKWPSASITLRQFSGTLVITLRLLGADRFAHLD